MNCPNHIVIGPIIYNMRFESLEAVKEVVNDAIGFDEERGNLESVKFEGCISYQDSIISIRKNMDKRYTKVVVLHELMHAISTQYNADLTEKQCDTLAYSLLQLIDDNPFLFQWLGSE